MSALKEKTSIGKYRVLSLIKENEYTETYKVMDEKENVYFLKLYILKKTPEKLVNTDTCEVYDIEHCRQLSHTNIVSFVESGMIQLDCGECQYLVTCYFTGDLLQDLVQREGRMEPKRALEIYRGILTGLKYLHEQGLYHNDITPRNIMLSKVAGGIPEIIDMGHTSPRCNGKVPFEVTDLEMLYCANETFMGMYDEQTDIFAATGVLYFLLSGKAPWQVELPEGAGRMSRFTIVKNKRRAESLDFEGLDLDDRLKGILVKGLAVKYQDRFSSADQILRILEGNASIETPVSPTDTVQEDRRGSRPQSPAKESTAFSIQTAKGNGFKDIAGMHELKHMLTQKVLFVLKNKEIAERYKLTPPNGMLLYGPPGCGKTFFAEKFAEETGFNYMMVKSSDLASIYIHGSQEKIGELFKQASQKAPMVLCFDEFDALVPNRTGIDNPSMSGEVNEFLSQLNNCSQKGIFVIATSNRPDKIDPAVLRTGRIDKQVYVPLPDTEARKEMFMIHLKGRPYDEQDIDAAKLAEMSDGYIASDIAYIVNDAAMTAAFTSQAITQQLLETILKSTRPSIQPEMVKMYQELECKMQGVERRNMDRPKIGYV